MPVAAAARLLPFLLTTSLALLATAAHSAPLLLNEYNGVREDRILKNGGSDPALGTPPGTPIPGNGSAGAPVGSRNDWLELVIVADHLDLRGWALRQNDAGIVQPDLIFSQDPLWADLRAGTLLTLFEADDLPEDLAYDPASGDYTLAVRVNAGTSGALISAQDLEVSNDDFQLTVFDARGRIMFGPAGEGVEPASGIGSDEVMELKADPSELITPFSVEYGDGSDSTFAAPNEFNGGVDVQDFSALRAGTPILDADRDGIPDCSDNCRLVFNPWQTNSDGDAFGNDCDPDFDNDGNVGPADDAALQARLGESVDATNEVFDLNDDLQIDAGDVAIANGYSGGPPGPAAQANPACDAIDPTEALFDLGRLVDVQITLTPADWDALRTQTRDVGEALPCAEAPRTSPFTFFPADVAIDGTLVANIGVRKKGFQGSLSTARPSLRLDLSEFVSGQQFEGMDRLTLNNNRQDPSRVQTCLAYHMMRNAGLPAPRCNFARVTVNGQDLGIYSNVESIRNPFLVRNFGSAAGNLYEGTLSDLRAGSFGTFEIKNGGDRQDILALAHLLEGTDAEITAELANHLDVDAFLDFWAMEGLVGHWDGHNGNNNNFWIFNDPTTGLRFIPWGADATFGAASPFSGAAPISPSVFLNSQLAFRLYQIPGFQSQYLSRLFALRATHFPQGGDPALLATLDAMEALINPVGAPGSDPVITAGIADRRQWVMDRFDHVTTEFAQGDPTAPASLAPRACLQDSGTATIVVDTTVTDNPGGIPALCFTCSLDVTILGQTYSVPVSLQAFDRNQNPIGNDSFGLLAVGGITGTVPAVLTSVDPSIVPPIPGVVNIPDGLGNGVVVLVDLDVSPPGFQIAGFLSNAMLSLTAFGTNVGDDVEGTLTADTLEFTTAPLNPLPPLGGSDSDGDGVTDDQDSCIDVPNPGQADTDGDQIGNACDCDFDQDGFCSIADFNVFLPDFQTSTDAGAGTDMNASGNVGIEDFTLFLPGFMTGVPGPSGLLP